MRALIVDRENPEHRLLAGISGFQVSVARTARDAVAKVREMSFDAALINLGHLSPDGCVLLKMLTRARPRMPIIAMVGSRSISTATQAIRDGADECVTYRLSAREIHSIIKATVHETAGALAGTRRAKEIRKQLCPQLGAGEAMQRVYRRVERLAPTSRNVLIVGEPGTGRLLIAKAVHELSKRRNGTFRSASCLGDSAAILTIRFFGQESDTTDLAESAGALEAARAGTLLISRIDHMPRNIQSALHEALRSGQIRRIGSTRRVPVDARLISCSSTLPLGDGGQNMDADLSDRLAEAIIPIPPLRERPEDILQLASRSMRDCCNDYGMSPGRFSKASLEALRTYEWPGNLMELDRVVQRAVVASFGRDILPADLQISSKLDDVVDDHIRRILESTGGDKSRAARILGISRTCLYAKLRRHDGS